MVKEFHARRVLSVSHLEAWSGLLTELRPRMAPPTGIFRDKRLENVCCHMPLSDGSSFDLRAPKRSQKIVYTAVSSAMPRNNASSIFGCRPNLSSKFAAFVSSMTDLVARIACEDARP